MRNRIDRGKPARPAPDRLDPAVRRLFAYLDEELGPAERAAFEAELASDPGLAAEVRAFRSLLAALGRMAAFAPTADFKVRVLAALRARRPGWLRLRVWIRGTGHPAVRNVFSELLEEGLPPRQARAMAAFVAHDREAAAALTGWRRLHERLGRLPALAPREGFEERVMARVEAVPVVAGARGQAWRRVLMLWPERRQRLAAALGMAFAPTALVASLGYVLVGIFRDPLVTPGRAAGFLWEKASSAASALSNALLGGWSPEGAAALGSANVLGTLVPLALLGLLVFGVLSLISGRILYRIFVNHSGMDRRHVPV